MKNKLFSFVLIFFMTVSGARAADLVAKINRAIQNPSGGEISLVRVLTSDQVDFLAMLAQWTMEGERYVDLAERGDKALAREGNIKTFVRQFHRFSNRKPLHLLQFITKIPGFVGYWHGAAASLPALPRAASIPNLAAAGGAALSPAQRSQILAALDRQMRAMSGAQEKLRLSGIYEGNIGHLLTGLSADIILPADDEPTQSLRSRLSWTSVEPDKSGVTEGYFVSSIKSLKQSRTENPEEMTIISLYKGNKGKAITLRGLSEKLAVSTFYPDFEKRVLHKTISPKPGEEVSFPAKVAVAMAGLLKYADEKGVRFGDSGRAAEKGLAREVVDILTGKTYGLRSTRVTRNEFQSAYCALSESVRWLGNFEDLVTAFEVRGLARKITRDNDKRDIHRRNVFLCACIAWSENDQNREGIHLVKSISRALGQDPLETIGQYGDLDHKFGLLGYSARRDEYNRPVMYKDLVE